LSRVACKPALNRLAHTLHFYVLRIGHAARGFTPDSSCGIQAAGFKLRPGRISAKKRRAAPMRTRENTRKCMTLRDKQKWMHARNVRSV
jgi:hypothetical protein